VQTFFLKFVLPSLWLGGFGFGAALLRPPSDTNWMFLAAFAIAGLSLYWWGVRLKRVVMTHGELRISNYRREIVVPFSEIDEVTENRWVNVHPVTVQFVRRTDFGQRIVFMPKARPFALFSSHPIVGELRSAAAAAKRG
jgi:hypothetical protein